jgi:hypothetical protein
MATAKKKATPKKATPEKKEAPKSAPEGKTDADTKDLEARVARLEKLAGTLKTQFGVEEDD